jgi:hypothetical protein
VEGRTWSAQIRKPFDVLTEGLISEKAEREGLYTAVFCNLLLSNRFGYNLFLHGQFAKSSCSRYQPDIRSIGGRQPGQVRDKCHQANWPGEPFSPGPFPPEEPLLAASIRGARGRRKGPRSRQEVEDERRQLEEETERELDKIASEFHSQLSRDDASSIGAIYARYSTRYQHSIGDQVRALFEAALKLKIFIPRKHIFCDRAVRGVKENRPGLNRLRDALTSKKIDVLLVPFFAPWSLLQPTTGLASALPL